MHTRNLILIALLACSSALPAATPAPQWVTAWAATFQGMGRDLPGDLRGRTFRYRLTAAADGTQVRVRFTNEMERSSLAIAAATIARTDGATRTYKVVTFGDRPTGNAPAGAPLLSDPIDLPVQTGTELVISVYFDASYAPENHAAVKEGGIKAEFTGPGDFTRDASAPGTAMSNTLVSALDVLPAKPWRSVLVLGATRSTGPGTWPDFLVARAAKSNIAIANRSQLAGALHIGRPGEGALARFDRDVLSAPGVDWIVLDQGNDDLVVAGIQNQWTQTAGGKNNLTTVGDTGQIIAGFQQIIARAHDHGIKVMGATIAPFEGTNYSSPERVAKRRVLNEWIRNSGQFDAVLEFAKVLEDPTHTDRILPALDTGNHREPNARGHQAIADSIDLAVFAK